MTEPCCHIPAPHFGLCWAVLLTTDTPPQSALGVWDITVQYKAGGCSNAGVKLHPIYTGNGMKCCGFPPWSTAVHWLLAQESCSSSGSGSWHRKASPPQRGERLLLHEEDLQGGEGTANFVLLSDSAETNMCSTNNGVGLIIRARNFQRVSKYGKEWGDPEVPQPGVSPVPPRLCRTTAGGCSQGSCCGYFAFKNPQGTRISQPPREGLAVLAQGPATTPGQGVPAGPGWIWAELWPA